MGSPWRFNLSHHRWVRVGVCGSALSRTRGALIWWTRWTLSLILFTLEIFLFRWHLFTLLWVCIQLGVSLLISLIEILLVALRSSIGILIWNWSTILLLELGGFDTNFLISRVNKRICLILGVWRCLKWHNPTYLSCLGGILCKCGIQTSEQLMDCIVLWPLIASKIVHQTGNWLLSSGILACLYLSSSSCLWKSELIRYLVIT